MNMLGALDEKKVAEARVENAVAAAADAMLRVKGITVPEMMSAALRLTERSAVTALEQSTDGALERNQALMRNCLQNLMLAAASDTRGTKC